jgi:hypothetical protein
LISRGSHVIIVLHAAKDVLRDSNSSKGCTLLVVVLYLTEVASVAV